MKALWAVNRRFTVSSSSSSCRPWKMLGILQYIFSKERVCKLAMGGHRRSSSHVVYAGIQKQWSCIARFSTGADGRASCICCHQLIQPERRIPAAKRPGHHSCNLCQLFTWELERSNQFWSQSHKHRMLQQSLKNEITKPTTHKTHLVSVLLLSRDLDKELQTCRSALYSSLNSFLAAFQIHKRSSGLLCLLKSIMACFFSPDKHLLLKINLSVLN